MTDQSDASADPSEGETGSKIADIPGEDAAIPMTPEEVAALRSMYAGQAKQIEGLQQQLNESQVKYGEQVYWLRLELDSSRREKEAVEDRMAELYRGVQELLSSPLKDDDDKSNNNKGDDNDDIICTEPDYVHALQERLVAYERSVEILNRQIDMMKTSSGVVVTSMKQEVTDLVEEKSVMERDLLNQISNLDNAKRRLEHQLLAHQRAKDEQGNAEREEGLPQGTSSDTSTCIRPPALASEMVAQSSDENGIAPSGTKDMSIDGVAVIPEATTMEPEKIHEESFRSTATTQWSSFTHDIIPSAMEESGEAQREQSLLVESLHEEVCSWKEEAGASKAANLKLQAKVEEVTKELMFTRSSANVALALDRIETDRAETVAHLDRIAVLWDRADNTIQVMEGLLAEFQPRTASPECHPSNHTDRERLLSTLENATLVHGQIKMSLMLIELTFRNHLTCIQNDNLQELQNAQVSDKLEQVRTDTLSAIAQVETKWNVAVEQVERQIYSDNQSTNESLSVQMHELQQARDKQKVLESVLKTLKQQSPSQANMEAATSNANGLTTNNEGEATAPGVVSSMENSSGGLVVSRSVLFKLQQEILNVVAVVQEKNEGIRILMATIDKYKLREQVLKKELKRVAPRAQKKGKAKDRIMPKNTLDWSKEPAVNRTGAKKSTRTSSKEKKGDDASLPLLRVPAGEVATRKVAPSSPASLVPAKHAPPSESERCWSSL